MWTVSIKAKLVLLKWWTKPRSECWHSAFLCCSPCIVQMLVRTIGLLMPLCGLQQVLTFWPLNPRCQWAVTVHTTAADWIFSLDCRFCLMPTVRIPWDHMRPHDDNITRNTFLPHLVGRFARQNVAFTTSTWTNALSCCRVISRVAKWLNAVLNDVATKAVFTSVLFGLDETK